MRYTNWHFTYLLTYTVWLGDRKGIRPVKKLGVGLLVVMIWLELCTTYSSSCHHSPPPSSFASINTGQLGLTWKMAVKTERERGWIGVLCIYVIRSDGLECGASEVLAGVGYRTVQPGRRCCWSVWFDWHWAVPAVAWWLCSAGSERHRQHFLDASRAAEKVQVCWYGLVSVLAAAFVRLIPVSEMTYTVSSGTLNPSIPIVF